MRKEVNIMRKLFGFGLLVLAASFLLAATFDSANAQTKTSTPTMTPTTTPTGSVMGATTTPAAPATGFGY